MLNPSATMETMPEKALRRWLTKVIKRRAIHGGYNSIGIQSPASLDKH
jgi:hypothetical protein